MFTGFTQETIDFFIKLSFNNYTSFFQENKEEYIEKVRTPFYNFIDEMAPTLLLIDPEIDVRPHKALARIRRDTRFTKDKSPYRDHLWITFKKAAVPREESLMFWFELSPREVGWGMGFWGENKIAFDLLRKNLESKPEAFLKAVEASNLSKHQLFLTGEDYKRLEVPPKVPLALQQWYTKKRLYIQKTAPPYELAFTKDLVPTVQKDFLTLKPLYNALLGIVDQE